MIKKILIPSFILLIYFVLGVHEFRSISINQTDKISDFVINKLWPVVLILSIGATAWIFWAYELYKNKKIKTFIQIIIAILLCCFFHYAVLQGYVSMFNRLVGNQEEVEIKGIVKSISTQTSSGATRYYLTIMQNTGQVLELKVPKGIANSYAINGLITLSMYKGSLGFLYIY